VVTISNESRVVFPEAGHTKGDVVRYYERIAPRALPHLTGRPLSIKRYPKGLAGAGFFQKNVPPHYPESIARFEVPRSRAAAKKHPKKGAAADDKTVYPLVSEAEHLAYLGNQGAIELHVTPARASDMQHPDRLVLDLDPPPGALDLVRRAAHLARAGLERYGIVATPLATGSKGYHLVAPLVPTVPVETLATTMHKLATLLAAEHPDELTTVFRVALRGPRVFVDWLRNNPSASVVAPYSLRARAAAPVATPLSWAEIDTVAPDAFTLTDVERLLERPDPLAAQAASPSDPLPFVRDVDAAFDRSGLVLEIFDRFRS